ncbi:hypothetical protein PAPYR_1987 [Paratrimastix pyriformis]|uniref:Uncharacterized protein n=1 Tax=Paratrimastix pyriformis TaxID=342808 RepID=A0ABQ8USJ3_9EUKA|nr:hypothetical protein PAPYR_1987 [Paratrimastix pyriformis]
MLPTLNKSRTTQNNRSPLKPIPSQIEISQDIQAKYHRKHSCNQKLMKGWGCQPSEKAISHFNFDEGGHCEEDTSSTLSLDPTNGREPETVVVDPPGIPPPATASDLCGTPFSPVGAFPLALPLFLPWGLGPEEEAAAPTPEPLPPFVPLMTPTGVISLVPHPLSGRLPPLPSVPQPPAAPFVAPDPYQLWMCHEWTSQSALGAASSGILLGAVMASMGSLPEGPAWAHAATPQGTAPPETDLAHSCPSPAPRG